RASAPMHCRPCLVNRWSAPVIVSWGRRPLLGAAIVFIEARHQLTQVLFDPRTRYADECPLDVVPELQSLLSDCVTTIGGACHSSISISRRRRLSTKRGRQNYAADDGCPEKQLRPLSKLLAPISGGIDPLPQLSQVRPPAFTRAVDMRLYFVGCFIHSMFSLTDCTVRSGTG